jgi:hypothetical protein
MSDGKLSERERYNNLKREVDVIKSVFQFLLQGKFSGASAQELVVAQMYMQGLYKHMEAELKKLEPLSLPKQEEAVVAPLAAVESDSTAA